MPFVVGENVGQYRILAQLGQGGMATVYKAYHASLDRYVAVKALHPAFTQDPNFLARFQREARVVAKLDHPHIVPIYDFAEGDGRPYLVMKYVEGETLKARLKRGPLDGGEIQNILTSVGVALSYAHREGVLHRDVKPSNVLLAQEGRNYLSDFGLARIAEAGESTLSSDMMLGTPHYISPEQAQGQRDLDERTDIYSFGVLLYELVVGRVPFSADTPFSIIHDHIYTPLPLPRDINPQVDEGVERVLLKALAKDREDRYKDVESMVTAFNTAISATLTVAEQVQLQEAPLPVEEPLAPKPIDLSTGIGEEGVVKAERAGEAETIQISTAEDTPQKRRRWWIPVLIMLILCICGIGFVITTRQDRTAMAPLTETVELPPTWTLPEGEGGEVTLERPPLEEMDDPQPIPPEELEILIKRMEENPDDPFAHLELAAGFFELGLLDEARRQYEIAMELGADDMPFLLGAGEFMMQRELWMEAAGLYLRAVNVSPEPLPDEILENLNQSLYLAADNPEIEQLLSEPRLERIRAPIIDVVRARHVLYMGDVGHAEELLGELRRLEVQIPETDLLEAEFLLATGNPEAAMPILDELSYTRDVPFWISAVARFMLDEVIQILNP
jgi:serine/threonine protein kinase